MLTETHVSCYCGMDRNCKIVVDEVERDTESDASVSRRNQVSIREQDLKILFKGFIETFEIQKVMEALSKSV